MTISVNPNESAAFTAVRSLLLSVLPSGIEIVRGQPNRVPEVASSDFLIMTPIRRGRLETNKDSYVDAKMVGSISGTTMTITQVDYGSLQIGSVIFGVGVADGTQVTAFGTGSGGLGTYTVSPSQSIASEVLAAGVLNAEQHIDLTIQIDVHGPNSGDNSQIVTTIMRDDYAALWLKRSEWAGQVAPLFCENPRQIPFVNGENQYEDRWVVETSVQVNAVVQDIPQQFFDAVTISLVAADAKYVP